MCTLTKAAGVGPKPLYPLSLLKAGVHDSGTRGDRENTGVNPTNMPNSLRLCREAEPLRPFFIEDPLRSEDPGSYEMLRLRTAVPLAAGEQFGSKWEFRELVEKEWIDYARVDLCIAGGTTEEKRIADHVRDPPREARRPQPARTCLDGRLPAPEPLVP